MNDKIKLYQYDYAAYYTGNILEIEAHEGYSPAYLTPMPLPEIPEGYFAKFEKNIQQWIVTEKPAPEYIDTHQVIENQLLSDPVLQAEPSVI